MPEFVCPQCQAAIEPDLIESTGRAECPFCGADVSALGLPAPPADAAVDAEPAAEGEFSRPIPPAPAKSLIRVMESTPDRLVLFVPPGGGQATGIGCFALFWNGFMALFTVLIVRGVLVREGQQAPETGLLVFLALFWGAGLLMLWLWLKFRFERTFVLLDRDRIAVKKVLFGRNRLHETTLGAQSRAELVESYQQNEVPVYRIEVSGEDGAAKFGTALSNGEKDWIVDRINEFLHPAESGAPDEEAPEVAGSGNTAGMLSPAEALSAEPTAGDCVLEVVESDAAGLQFWYAVAPHSVLRWAVPLLLVPFGAIWVLVSGYFLWNRLAGPFQIMQWIGALFFSPVVAVGFVILLVPAYVRWGRTTITLSRTQLACRWSMGPLGYTRRLSVPELTSVQVEFSEGTAAHRVRRKRNIRDTGGRWTTCVARAGLRSMALTYFNDEGLARQVAALVQKKLVEWEHPAATP